MVTKYVAKVYSVWYYFTKAKPILAVSATQQSKQTASLRGAGLEWTVGVDIKRDDWAAIAIVSCDCRMGNRLHALLGGLLVRHVWIILLTISGACKQW